MRGSLLNKYQRYRLTWCHIPVGVGSLYVDAAQVVLLTNEIEGHRLLHEELNGLQGDIKVGIILDTNVHPTWHLTCSSMCVAP